MSTIWQLSSIWLWDKAHPTDIGPLAVLLPVGLYGVYIVVFSLSVWAMFWDGKRVSGFRWVVVATFVVVTFYIVATLVSYPVDLNAISDMPLLRFNLFEIAWCNMSPCVCCSLSDSVLAWRCYVIFGKRRWLKWTLTIIILVITVNGIFSSIVNFLTDWGITIHGDDRHASMVSSFGSLVAVPTTLTWAVSSLVLNTILSTSIVAKIVIVSRQTNRHFASSRSIPLARAFIESSLMSWIALAVYTGLYATANSLPYAAFVGQAQLVLNAMLPLIFSISQALVIARLGISRFAASPSFKDTIVALTSDHRDDGAPCSRAVAWQDVETWSDQ